MPLTGSNGPIWVRNVGGGGFGDFIIGTLVLPALVDAADPAGLTDQRMATLSIDATGRLRCVISAASGAVFTTVPRALQSTGSTGRVVAPGAGAAITTIAAGALPAGTYDVQVFAAYDAGAPVAAEINNMEFRRGAGVVSALQVLAVLNLYAGFPRLFRMVMDGATALSVNATGAGTAAVGYNAQLIATQVV